jgi:predicted DNA-binding transcriptional regulator AlpA
VAGAAADAVGLIDKERLCERLGVSPWTLQRMVRAAKFPAPIWLGPTTPRWRLAEVEAWQADPARRQRPKPEQPKAVGK